STFINTSLLLFFYCSADHRDLHSFPTRRSSDLIFWLRRGLRRFVAAPGKCEMDLYDELIKEGELVVELWPMFDAYDLRLTFMSRSEEHTSELQSRFDLVCRLLLEKKTLEDVGDPVARDKGMPVGAPPMEGDSLTGHREGPAEDRLPLVGLDREDSHLVLDAVLIEH